MSNGAAELGIVVNEGQFTPTLPHGSVLQWNPVRDHNFLEDQIVATGKNAIRIIEDTIEAAENVIRATEIVKQTLREAGGLTAEELAVQKDFGELRPVRDDAGQNQALRSGTHSGLRLLFPACAGISAVSVILVLVSMGKLPLSRADDEGRVVSMTNMAEMPLLRDDTVPGRIVARHDRGEMGEVEVSFPAAGNKDGMPVNSVNQETILQTPKMARPPIGLLSSEQIADLIERGSEFVDLGDLNSARLLFQRAAEARDPQAAFALAATYDPIALQELGIHSPAADAAVARVWYRKAEEFGSRAASRRLELLASRSR